MPDELKASTLRIVADNATLAGLLKEIFVAKLPEVPSSVDTVDDATLGQKVRARATALKAINEAFVEIEKYKTRNKPTLTKNPGR